MALIYVLHIFFSFFLNYWQCFNLKTAGHSFSDILKKKPTFSNKFFKKSYVKAPFL